MKRIEAFIPLFTHLVTRNDNRPFNEVWDIYFKDFPIPIGYMSYEELFDWFQSDITEEDFKTWYTNIQGDTRNESI